MRVNQPVTQHEFQVADGATLMSTTDPSSHIGYANAAFIEASGFSREELEGQPHNIVRHPDMPVEAFADMWATLKAGEPWTALAVKLMLKWPGLHYSTSAFAPKHYPKDIIDYANTRGADKIIYAGYFPMGLSLERIMTDMQNVPFKDEVWPKFLRENAKRVLKL